MGKCVYCKGETPEGAVLDVCRRCGIGVWGEKMYNAILENMEGAKESGDLYQGSITVDAKAKGKVQSSQPAKKMSLFTDAIKTLENNPDNDIKYDSYNKAA